MSARLSDDDVGKPVVNANGERIGTVATVEGDAVRVDPDTGLTETIKAALGWSKPSTRSYVLDEDAVERVTNDEVRLKGSEPPEANRSTRDGKSGPATDEKATPDSRSGVFDPNRREPGVGDLESEHGVDPEDAISREERRETGTTRELEVDPTEVTNREPEAELRPEEDVGDRTDAEVEPTDPSERTDARVDPEADRGRTDTDVGLERGDDLRYSVPSEAESEEPDEMELRETEPADDRARDAGAEDDEDDLSS
ncbi:PRC-barrel domain-containing protein [Natribaculum luteum]|uniref:PRC-barrel domain-containing protein n=1 Tax=Natribaculum luteum TaxID=1586232 RepID=A0ABD5NV54_9EURY|nr:PRC-barrel domain-containing protein [Natribaculum luteum]